MPPLGLLFLFCTSDQQKNINFVGDHPMNIPTSLVPIGPVVSENKIKM